MAADTNIKASKKNPVRFALLGLGLGFVITAVFGLSQIVLAQGSSLGLNEFAANTNLGTNTDLIGMISRIINIALGFLGVIAIGLVLYAGWLWMTSKGDAQQIAKAKKIMAGGVIGLAIILSAFAIASFIINQIQNSTGGGGGPQTCWDGTPPPCPPPILPGNYLSVRSQGPMGNGIKLCEAVQAGFSEAVQWSTVTPANFSIQEAATNTPFISGVYQPGTDSSNIAFVHYGERPNEEFAPNTTYRVTLRSGGSGLMGVTNISLRTDKVWTFTTGTQSDDEAPTVVATQPPTGSVEVCRSTPIQVVFSEPMLATSFINNVSLVGGGNSIALSAPTFGDGYRIANFTIQQELTANTTYTVTLNGGTGGITDTCGIPLATDYTWTFETGETTDCTPEITAVAPDRRDYGQATTITGTNLFLDGEVYVNNYPADSNSFPGTVPPENILCWAGVSRDGSTICSASQVRVRAPVGASTGPAYDQSGFTQTAGEIHLNIAGSNSNELPFSITSPFIDSLSPNSGGIGQYVTVSGWNFGDTSGQVRFIRSDGTYLVADPPENCSDWWNETEIIIKVPTGLVAGVTYQVEVITAAGGTNGGSKRSNSESFLVTSQPPGPGICTLLPISSPLAGLPIDVTVTGERFGTSRGSSVLTFDNAHNINSTSYTSWSEGEIIAQTPTGSGGINLLGSGNWRAQVKVGGVLSNWKNFNVGPDTNIYPQVVESASCSNNTQSPSPYKNSTDGCANAVVSARFTIPMNSATLTVGGSGNITVEECGNGINPGACTISLSFAPATYIYDAQNNVIGFSATPNTNFRQGYWYKGTITTNVTSLAGAAMQAPYAWNFRVASAACPLANVILSPSYATIRELVPDPASRQSFHASATASNCNIIDPQDYSWAWTASNNPADPPPPSRIQLLGGGSSAETSDPSNSIEALAYTPAGEPAKFKVEAVGENKSDTSDVYVSGTFCTEIEDCNACGAGISRCIAGVCEPVITDLSPTDGAPGTWLTIAGCYFGNTRGRIEYAGGIEGVWPDPAICGSNTWTNTQVISEVPDRAESGPIILERAIPPGGAANSSPRVFNVNTVLRPGLCRLSPNYHYQAELGTPQATVTIDGNAFGTTRQVVLTSNNWLVRVFDFVKDVLAQSFTFPINQDNVNYYFNNLYTGSALSYPSWNNNHVQAITPVPPASTVGLNQISINKLAIESNKLSYNILPGGGGGVGESCDLNPATPSCEVNNNFCASGLFCDPSRCTCQLGSGQLPRIISVTPIPGATNICRNTVLTITFDQPVTANTIRDGQLTLVDDGFCLATSAPTNWRERLARWFRLILPSFAQNLRIIPGTLSVFNNSITFTPNNPLCIGELHQVNITSPQVDCANSAGLCQWSFTTGANICKVHSVLITPPSHLYTDVGQLQTFMAQARSIEGQNLAATYSWQEQDQQDVVTTWSSPPQSMVAEANNKNGEASIKVTATGIGANSGSATKSAALTVYLCEVPWSNVVSDANYDFNLIYCRGEASDPPEDLLPDFSATYISGTGDLLREYLLKHPDLNEVIGLRIYSNPKHLSPQQWYETRPDITHGSPGTILVDGYKAVSDTQTTYVGAVANPGGGSDLYTNIYVLSFNQGASPETLEIYNQMVNSWMFNPNIAVEDQQKLQRDLTRLQDMAYVESKLITYESGHNTFPKLPAGSFVVGKSTSVWPSWQAEFANALGSGLPVDPINKFVNCPAGYDPVTCWRSTDKSFVCPAGSHAYQYTVGGNGNSYTLNANLEYKNVTWRGTPDIIINNSDECNSYSSSGSGGGGTPIGQDDDPPEQVTLIVTPQYSPTGFQISWSAATDNGGSGLSHYELWRAPDIPGNSPGAWQQIGGPILSQFIANEPLADGGYWYGVHAVDNQDNSATEQEPILVFKDAVPPNDPVCTPAGGIYSSGQQVSCTASDQGAFTTTIKVHFTTDSVTPSCGSPIFNNPTLINSSTKLNFIACDAANNASSVISHTYTINTVLPIANLTLNTEDSSGLALSGADVSVDGNDSGQTPITTTVSLGSHSVYFSDSLACYKFSSISPPQPMNITGDTTVTGVYEQTTPSLAASPSPILGATGVSITPTLNWGIAACSSSYDVYLGTSQTAVQTATISSPEFKNNVTTTVYNSASLEYSTVYYWRVDARNGAGVTKGTVWSFTTAATPTATITFTSQDNNNNNLPGAYVWLDNKLVGTTSTSTSVPYGSHTVTWSSDFSGPASCYVFDSATPASPINVSGNMTVVGIYNQNLPSQTNNPLPATSATNVPTSLSQVNWGSGGCTGSFEIYFGTDIDAVQNATTSSPEYKGTSTTTTWPISGLVNASTYYWRVDARNTAGLTKGVVWQFSTENPSTITLSLNARDDANNSLPGAPVRLDGLSVGNTPTTTLTNLGNHTLAFDNTVNCFNFASISPTQPMNVTGNATVTGIYNRVVPAQVSSTGISPANSSTNISINTVLSWTAANCAASYNVYFGTNSGSPPQATVTNSTSYTPIGLTYSTTYYWRIDSVNNGLVTTGQTFSFTTQTQPTAVITFQSRDNFNAVLTGASARLDGTLVGTTTTTSPATLGSHTASIDDTLSCYKLSSVSPSQPMNVIGPVTVTGTFNQNLPNQVINPAPSNGLSGALVTTSLSWSSAGCTNTYEIYFGTNQTAVQNATTTSSEYRGSTSITSTTLGSLTYSTTYYWRIDSRNNAGVTKGLIWSFTTEPSPNATITYESRNSLGTIIPGATARLDSVYVGMTPISTSTIVGTHTASFDNTVNCFNFASISPAQPMNVTGNVTVVGTFTTSLPGAVTYINPSNGATNIIITPSLSWNASCATSYDVYIGTNQTAVFNATMTSSEFKTNTTNTTYTSPALNYSTTYYWRIDARSSAGFTKGTVRSFTTQAPPTAMITFQSRDISGTIIAGATARLDGVYVGMTPVSTSATYGSHTVSFDDTVTCSTYTSISPTQPMTVTGDINVIGTFSASMPGAPTYFSPGNGEINMTITPSFSWNTSCATSYDVYIGTNQAAVLNATTSSSEFRGNTVNKNYTSPALNYLTTYYWRIDARSSAGVTKGAVRNFTTMAQPNLSIEAHDDQGNRLHNVPVYFDGVWVGSTYSYMPLYINAPLGTHQVIFNSTFDCYNYNNTVPNQPMNVTASSSVVGNFSPQAIPGAASPYYPANNDNNASISQIAQDGISFSISCGTSNFDIYFGTNFNAVQNATTSSPEFIDNYTVTELPGPAFFVGTLNSDTAYYWRVDTKNNLGTNKGQVWGFKTALTD